MGDSGEIERSSTDDLGTRTSLPCESARIKTSPSSREQQTADDLAVLESEVGDAKGLVDVAVGVEDVFHQAVEAAAADAVELGADLGPLAAELVADRAVLLEDLGPRARVGLGAIEIRRGGGRKGRSASGRPGAGP